MKKSILVTLGSLTLSSAALAQQVPDFIASNVNAPSPANTTEKPGQWATPGAPDPYSDSAQLPFRAGQPSYQAELTTVPTFQSIGIYWAPPRAAVDKRARVAFRKQGDSAWRQGLPLWFDPRNHEYRGSLVTLDAGVTYEIALSLADEPGTIANTIQTTWADKFHVVQTIIVPQTSSETYEITTEGKPGAYVAYVADPVHGSVIDMGATDLHKARGNSCVHIAASHVIVRGLTLRNCQRQGIEISAPSQDVVIENNDISGFGSSSGTEAPPTAGNVPTNKIVPGLMYEAGIYCENTDKPVEQRVQRVIIQRNTIHDPRYGSFSWSYGHPNSAQAITLSHCGSNHVVRYNDIHSTPGHFFNDGIGGLSNFTFEGFPNADSDINGNDVSGVYDDAIESEGANRNVRIWGNYLHQTNVGIAMATVSQGPVYAFRNVITDSTAMGYPNAPDQDANHGIFFKLGSEQAIVNGGRTFIFHNSSLQPPAISGTTHYPLGVASFMARIGLGTCNIVSRNNLMTVNQNWKSVIYLNEVCGANDLDYDAYDGVNSSGSTVAQEVNGVKAVSGGKQVQLDDSVVVLPEYTINTYGDYPDAQYKTGIVVSSTHPSELGYFYLKPTSLGAGKGTYLPNFNDLSSGVDTGAHQRGAPKMEFGVNAYLPTP